ncbi:tRNA (mnm(5)s(2)U34)-methyltransferase [Coraliomargarita parva]|uniref:tRNA (mnm(5)s(2)U34)-methyltransferase n=1 Tax=Coraliomargarita parva TaxID=3014050 RepID=UPI0022B50235|nr:class I SAM-dependent methyltransferase [Coraliomargarita parva]
MRLTELAHEYLDAHLHPGDRAIDATAGNGHDTLKLAQQVGSTGEVAAIDLQADAIRSTRQRLEENGMLKRVRLLEGDHAEQIPQLDGQWKLIIFNLGYLPGSDKSIQTRPAHTLRALDAGFDKLLPGGALLVTAYRGHPGGLEEAEAVAQWMQELSERGGQVQYHEPRTGGTRLPPVLWIAEKPGS